MIKPAPGYLLVKQEKKEEKSVGGIILSAQQDNVSRSKVLAVGGSLIKEHYTIESPAKLNDTIAHREFVGVEISEGSEKHLIIRFEDVLGVYE